MTIMKNTTFVAIVVIGHGDVVTRVMQLSLWKISAEIKKHPRIHVICVLLHLYVGVVANV